MPGLERLLTEQPNPASTSIDALETEEMLRVINAEDHKVADAVEREIPAIARAVDAIVAAIERGGRLFYVGAGTSGRLGVLDASECPPVPTRSPGESCTPGREASETAGGSGWRPASRTG